MINKLMMIGWFCLGLLLLIGLYLWSKKSRSRLALYQQAPEFVLLDQDNNLRALSEFRGHKVVIFFYPKAHTPGCTKEACSLRDKYSVYQDNDIVVLGISYDVPSTQKAFQEKFHLPFILLSDTKKEAAKAYGAYESFINILFPSRKTFLIDEVGKLVNIFDNVDVDNHADQILKGFGIDQK